MAATTVKDEEELQTFHLVKSYLDRIPVIKNNQTLLKEIYDTFTRCTRYERDDMFDQIANIRKNENPNVDIDPSTIRVLQANIRCYYPECNKNAKYCAEHRLEECYDECIIQDCKTKAIYCAKHNS